MGAGTSGLFPSTKGAKPHQMSLTPDPISARHRGPTYAVDGDGSTGMEGGGIGSVRGSFSIKDRTLLLTPPHILKKCLHWRIGAISEGDLVRWIQDKLNDGRYRMVPSRLRPVLVKYVSELKATRAAGKGYNTVAFFTIVTQLEEELEAMKQR